MSHALRDGDAVEWHVLVETAVIIPAAATVGRFKVYLRSQLKGLPRDVDCVVWNAQTRVAFDDSQPLQPLESPLHVTLEPSKRLRHQPQAVPGSAVADHRRQQEQQREAGGVAGGSLTSGGKPPRTALSFDEAFTPRDAPIMHLTQDQHDCQFTADNQASLLAPASVTLQPDDAAPPQTQQTSALQMGRAPSIEAGDDILRRLRSIETLSAEDEIPPRFTQTEQTSHIPTHDDDEDDSFEDGGGEQAANLSHKDQLDSISRRLRALLTKEQTALQSMLESWSAQTNAALGRVTGLLGQESVNLDGVKPAKDHPDYDKVTARRRVEATRITSKLQLIDELHLNMRRVLAMSARIADLPDDIDPVVEAAGEAGIETDGTPAALLAAVETADNKLEPRELVSPAEVNSSPSTDGALGS